MPYLLDTNICIALIRGREQAAPAHLQLHSPDDILLCSVVKSELIYGALRSADPARALDQLTRFWQPYVSLPLDDAAAAIVGRLRAGLAAAGRLISANDFQIAALALANNLTLVTRNTGEFGRVTGLRLEDWEAMP